MFTYKKSTKRQKQSTKSIKKKRTIRNRSFLLSFYRQLFFYTSKTFGAYNSTRTNNLSLTRRLLYQLSYASILRGIVYSPLYTPFNQTLCLARFVLFFKGYQSTLGDLTHNFPHIVLGYDISRQSTNTL